MSENDDSTQILQSLTFETLNSLENNSPPVNPNKPQQMEAYVNELTTNIIKDASKTDNEDYDENLNNTNELTFLQTSNQTQSENTTTTLDKSEHSTADHIHDDNHFDYEDIQSKMNGVIHDMRTQSGDDTNIPRKSITSNHMNNSTPIMNPISNNLTEGPIRPLSESALADHPVSTEVPLPIRQDESTSDNDDLYGIQSAPMNNSDLIDDYIDQHQSGQETRMNNPLDDGDDFFNTKTGTIDDNQPSSSIIKYNDLDETTHFGTTSASRVLSASSKHSIHITSDEPSVSGDEKHTQINPSKSPDDTDRDNQEIANVVISPLNRPRSPTPNDTNHSEINDTYTTSPILNTAKINSPDDNQQKEIFQSTNEIIPPASRRESTNKNDQQQTSRPSSSYTNHFTEAHESSKSIKSGEQLRIPTKGYDNERINSPPPSPSPTAGIKSMVFVNPLLGSHIIEKEQDQSPSPSRKSSTLSMVSNEKLLDGEILLPNSRRESNVSQQPLNTTDQKSISRHESQVIEQTSPVSNSLRASSSQQQDELDSHRDQQAESERINHRESSASEQQISSNRESAIVEQKSSNRKGSAVSEQQIPSRRESLAPEQQATSRRESTNDEEKIASRKGSTTFEQQASSKRESLAAEEQISSRRESHSAEQQSSDRRQSLSDQQEQKSSSKPVSRKTSEAEQQQIASRRESQQQASSSRRTSTNQNNHSSSPHRSSIVNISPSKESSRRNSALKQEQQSVPILANKDSRRSSLDKIDGNDQQIKLESNSSNKEIPSSDTDAPIRTSTKQKKDHTSSIDKRQKSSTTVDKNNKRRSSFHRRSEQQAKRNSNLITDETVVTPIITDRSKTRQQNGKYTSTTDSDFEHKPTTKLPLVNSSFQQEKSRRSEIKQISSSHPTTPSEDEQGTQWIKHTIIPPIHFTDDEQIAEDNQTIKKQSAADGQKTKGQHHSSRRSVSANSSTHIRLVDDKSLNSTSENNTDFDRHNRRNIKSKKKDMQTNTDQTLDSQQQQQQHNFFDESELTPQKPLKATKPMSDHLHSTRRRTLNKEQSSATPERNTPTVRCTVKQSNDSNQDNDPVNVNITVVVKKIASDETSIEQKPKQYFQTVQHSSTTADKEKSIQQKRIRSPEYQDRHTQSDTEQIITEKQKIHRRPKRISRTCQTYECVFRRMEREKHQALRATNDTEKTIQTRKSQLRPRKKSPKKYLSPYLPSDSFRIADALQKQHYQSRRYLSKSSSLARSLSPQGGRLLILRPTLPFHHTDAVNVQRVCLQYSIDLIPHGILPPHRTKSNVHKQPEQTNSLPMMSASSVNVPKNKSTSNKIGEHTHQRKTDGTV